MKHHPIDAVMLPKVSMTVRDGISQERTKMPGTCPGIVIVKRRGVA